MSDSTQSLGSLVQCPLCLEPFTDPRMLTPCFHTFCYTCLGDHLKHNDQNGQFQCPVCRKQLPIPENGADDFQKNFFANKCLDIVDGTKAKAGRATHDKQFGLEDLCSNSEEGDPCNRPESFCLKCRESYCGHCSKAHARSKATRGHAQVSMEDLTEEMFLEAKSLSEIPRCPKHEKKLKLFCKTCQNVVCSVCSHTSHQSHSIQRLTELDNDLQTELNDVITLVQSLIETNEEARVETNQSQQQIEHTSSGVTEAMTKISEAVQQILDSKTRDMQKKLTQMGGNSKIKIEIQNTTLSLKQKLVKSFHEFVKDLMKKGTVFNRLTKLPIVRRRLEGLKSSSSAPNKPCLKNIPSSFELLAESLDGLEHEVDLCGTSSSEPTFLLKFIVKQKGRAPHVVADVVQDDQERMGREACAVGPSPQEARPKVCMVTYGLGSDTSSAARMVRNEFQLDGKAVLEKRLQPLPTDRSQVDVICCSQEKIHSVVADFEINRQIADERNLVLLYQTYGGSLEETHTALGQQAALFKCIIWASIWDSDTFTAAMTRLADYIRQVTGLDAGAQKLAADVIQDGQHGRKERETLAAGVELSELIKPKVCMVTYGLGGDTSRAARMVRNELQLDGKAVLEKRLQPLPTDRSQVDVICCSEAKIHSVVADFEINQHISDERNLVLLYQTYGGSLEETHTALGQQAALFKCIIWASFWDSDTSTAAMTRLADYLRQVAGKNAHLPPLFGDVVHDGTESRKEQIYEAGPQVEPTEVMKPEVCMVTYGFTSTGDSAARMVSNELRIDEKVVSTLFQKRLDPLPTDRPQVDVICCLDEEIHSVVADFEIDDQIAEQRNLVLLYSTRGGSLEETRIALGQQARLFKCIIWSSIWDRDTSAAATTRLADYLRQVAGKDACMPPVTGDVVEHDEDSRKEHVSEAGQRVVAPQVIKPKVRMITYDSMSTDSAAEMVLNELDIDGKVAFFQRRLEPLPTDRPQVDVISCSDEAIHSVVADFEIDDNTAERRNLVLWYNNCDGSLEETHTALGQQARLFKCIIWSWMWDHDTSTAATTRLADYLRQVAGKEVDAPPVAGDVLRDNEDSRTEHASEASPQVEPTQVITPTKPKVCMVTYGIGGTDAAAQTVMNELQLDKKTIFFKEQLQPLSTDGPQVDVICCIDQKILTVVADFELDEKIAEERNLVLFHKKHGGNLEDTRNTLGQQSGLFKCIIWSSPWDLSSCYAATEKLADYLRQVAS